MYIVRYMYIYETIYVYKNIYIANICIYSTESIWGAS